VRLRVIMCVMAAMLLRAASQGADPADGGHGSGTGERPSKEPRRRLTPREPRQDVEDIERFVEENPDAALDMSHLTALDAALAEALVCYDDEPRSVTRVQKVRYQVAVPVTVGGEPGEKLEARERVIESTVEIRGKPLYLDGLKSLSPEAASVLSGHTGDLHLNGLKAFPADVAAAFSGGGCGGCLLSFDGLDTLDDESASALAECRSDVSLRGVKRLSEQAYSALVQRWWSVAVDEHGDYSEEPPTVRFSADVVIEKRLGHGTMIAVRALPAKGTLESYVGHLSRISGTAIIVSEEAAQALGMDATKTISIEEWRAIAGGHWPAFWRKPPRWAPLQQTMPHYSVGMGPMGFGSDALMYPVEEVVDLLLNMLDTRGRGLVVLSGEAGLLVTTQAAIIAKQHQEKSFTLEADEVRARLPGGEQAFMKQVGGTVGPGNGMGNGMGGGAF
jgi:hypothetical protein